MESHTRKSPGIEFREIDRSQYDTATDYSVTPTTTLLLGFADKGEPYTVRWINTVNSFTDQYGYPTNEPEKYLYAGVKEILDRRGRALVARLPYDNGSKDRFAAAKYRLCKSLSSEGEIVEGLSSVDSSLTSYVEFGFLSTELIDMDRYDKLKVGNGGAAADSVVVVDVSRQQYGVLSSYADSEGQEQRLECLGLMPVFVSPAQAMFYQGLISSELCVYGSGALSGTQYSTGLSAFTVVGDAQNRRDLVGSPGYVDVKFSSLSADRFAEQLSAQTLDEESVSRDAASQFPTFGFLGQDQLDKKNVKKLGFVVFKVFKDAANDNLVSFTPMEAYVGSLDRRSKDPSTGASDFLGTLVNQNSRLVNLFSNVTVDSTYTAAATIHVPNQVAPILGFGKTECVKKISYVNSVMNPMTMILDRCQDPNQVPIDIVCDAGVSNVAQFAGKYPDGEVDAVTSKVIATNAEIYPSAPGNNPWEFEAERPKYWHAVLRKFDEFCKSVRRDCMFVADGYRPLVLAGNEKAVRPTDLGSTIKNTIVPKLKYVQALNSSYSAGYLNWFHVADDVTGDFFWCPPSIKAAGVYVYTDAYHHKWDAPAGLERGGVLGAFDTSFDPRNDEAGQIYQQAWNYAVNYPMEGIIIEGQKTFQIQKTALDRVNVRRLMLHLETSVAAVARRFLYEGNTAYLRQKFVDTIKPIFEDAVGGQGVKEYAIRCDDSLNTTDVVERNEMRCVIGVKPIKTVEWIVCDFICTNQSATVSEEVLRD